MGSHALCHVRGVRALRGSQRRRLRVRRGARSTWRHEAPRAEPNRAARAAANRLWRSDGHRGKRSQSHPRDPVGRVLPGSEPAGEFRRRRPHAGIAGEMQSCQYRSPYAVSRTRFATNWLPVRPRNVNRCKSSCSANLSGSHPDRLSAPGCGACATARKSRLPKLALRPSCASAIQTVANERKRTGAFETCSSGGFIPTFMNTSAPHSFTRRRTPSMSCRERR